MLFVSPVLSEVLNLIEEFIGEKRITLKRVNGKWFAKVGG